MHPGHQVQTRVATGFTHRFAGYIKGSGCEPISASHHAIILSKSQTARPDAIECRRVRYHRNERVSYGKRYYQKRNSLKKCIKAGQ